jgi:hypothetical protein
MKNNFVEIVCVTALIVLSVLLINPFQFWMPDFMVMCMLALMVGAFGVFAVYIVREKVTDEREEAHRTTAGRNAFLVGAGILTLGIIVQGYTHSVDPWLALALIAMVVVKIASRIYSEKNH